MRSKSQLYHRTAYLTEPTVQHNSLHVFSLWHSIKATVNSLLLDFYTAVLKLSVQTSHEDFNLPFMV
jgi:hypothetical protein